MGLPTLKNLFSRYVVVCNTEFYWSKLLQLQVVCFLIELFFKAFVLFSKAKVNKSNRKVLAGT